MMTVTQLAKIRSLTGRGVSLVLVAAMAFSLSWASASPARASGFLSFLAPAPETGWVEGHETRARLIASGVVSSQFGAAVLLGVEIETTPGWKTYWRSPGDGGGMPPEFSWSASSNLAEADVQYPAPRRLKDPYGTSIGYKGGVLFPVVIRPENPLRPMKVALDLIYGVCDEICIPIEMTLELTVPSNLGSTAHAARLATALDTVPSAQAAMIEVVEAKAVLSGASPKLSVLARFPSQATQRDLFIEGPSGAYVPMTEPHTGTVDDGSVRFTVDLRGMGDVQHFTGETLRLTFVSDVANAEHQWVVTP